MAILRNCGIRKISFVLNNSSGVIVSASEICTVLDKQSNLKTDGKLKLFSPYKASPLRFNVRYIIGIL